MIRPPFLPGQTVRVKPVDKPAVVDALMLTETGWQARAVFWLNGDRRTEWLYPWELEESKHGNK